MINYELNVILQIHTKKRNRLTQSRLNDLVYVKYNRALVQRYKLRDTIDPIALKDIDDSNEWLTGRTEEDAEEDFVFDDDENLTWGHVASAAGVHEERFNLRSRGSRLGGSALGGSSQSQPLRHENEDEDEEDDEGYQSLDGDDMEEANTDFADDDAYI